MWLRRAPSRPDFCPQNGPLVNFHAWQRKIVGERIAASKAPKDCSLHCAAAFRCGGRVDHLEVVCNGKRSRKEPATRRQNVTRWTFERNAFGLAQAAGACFAPGARKAGISGPWTTTLLRHNQSDLCKPWPTRSPGLPEDAKYFCRVDFSGRSKSPKKYPDWNSTAG